MVEKTKLLFALTLLLLCYGCASKPVNSETEQPEAPDNDKKSNFFWSQWDDRVGELVKNQLNKPDPWESWNRKVFKFNDTLDRHIVIPVAKGYKWLLPDPAEKGVSNVFANLREVRTIVNDVLQAKLKQAGSDTGRLLINSTAGIGGLFDVASSIGLERHDEDFGQTLGYWGVESGPYIVMPFLGSFTLRDGVGRVGDATVDYVRQIDHIPTRNQVRLARAIELRARLLAAEEFVTGDRYAFIRNAYLQRREFLVKDGVVDDEFGEEDFDEDWDEDSLDEDELE